MQVQCLAVVTLFLLSSAAHVDGALRATRETSPGELKVESIPPASSPSRGILSRSAHHSALLLLSTGHRITAQLHQWLHPLSAAAVATTIALQLSGMPSSLEIQRARDVKRYDGYPYFAVLAGASQWCLYGSFTALVTHDATLWTMVAANGPGLLFGLFYVSTFLRFVPEGDKRRAALKGYLLFGAALLLVELASCAALGRRAVFGLGLLGSIGSAQIALSPFKTMPEVLATKSTRSWPLDLCLWNLIQSWATGGFGVANNDPWVWVPNLIGVIAAVIQLFFVARYWEKPLRLTCSCISSKRASASV